LQISKRSLYDYAIIGAGISGACVAYFLKKSGKNVVVIEKDDIASGGSGAAGAFLSPKICSKSRYTSFINDSFSYAIKFYRENFPEFLDEKGILRILRSEDEIKKCRDLEDFMPKDFRYLNSSEIDILNQNSCKFGGYFFSNGAVIDASGVISQMIKDIDLLKPLHVEHLEMVDGVYNIGDIEAKGVIICAGASEDFEQISYCGLKNIFGHRVDIETSTIVPFHLHKECSISASRDGIVHVGATHIPNYKYDKSKDYTKEIDEMLEKAKSYIDFKEFSVKNIYFGARNSTQDFFPVTGEVIDAKETLKKYPYIKKGTLVPREKYLFHKNLYICAGLGARGFVLAPKLASYLTQRICKETHIDKTIDTQRVFIRYVR